MLKERSAGVIIFFMKNEPLFLMLKYKNYWGFVRGQIEGKESEEETAVREAKEEANISNIQLIKEYKYDKQWFYKFDNQLIKKSAVYLLGEITEKESKNVKISFEHEDFKFLNLKDALDIMTIKNEKEMLQNAYKFIKKLKIQKNLSLFN